MKTRPSAFDRLRLSDWRYEDWFLPAPEAGLHPVVSDVESYVESRHLDSHPFFELARHSEPALRLWVCQELVMTNAFSQIVLFAASALVNVHLRAALTEVGFGEHGTVRGGVAKRAHPWLLNQLRESMGIPMSDVIPAPATVAFIERLALAATEPLSAVAAIGVGNERLIIPEYTAIKHCFESCVPHVNYRPFLDANLNEDIGHSELCYQLASALIALGEEAQAFLAAAIASVESRVRYFDELAAMVVVS
jgi:hypothetical protein